MRTRQTGGSIINVAERKWERGTLSSPCSPRFLSLSLLGIVMNHWRFMKHGTHTFWKEKHKHSATSGLLRRLRCDWNFVVQGKIVSERKKGGMKEKPEIIWFATFCPNLCLTLCWDLSDVEKKTKTQKYACLLFGQCLRHSFKTCSVQCKTGCIKTQNEWLSL